EVTRLNAYLTTAITQRRDPVDGELKVVNSDDNCLISLELEEGIPCQVCISAVVQAKRTHAIEVYGDKGTLIIASENQKDYIYGFRVWGCEIGGSFTELEIPKQLLFPQDYTDGRISAFLRVVDQWVNGIETQKEIVPSLKQGVYSQLLMDLCHQSSHSRTWVDVPSW
ncbi:oxidoreductase, partial [Cylindrospermopsis raciborskii CS-506_B]